MKKIYLLSLILLFLHISLSMAAEQIVQEEAKMKTTHISSDDALKSISYVQESFLGRYGKHPIFEGTSPIGSFNFENQKVFVNFRGALGIEFLQLFAGSLVPIDAAFGLEGQVHQGFMSAALGLKRSVLEGLTQYSQESSLPMDTLEVILGGYSRGSTIATLLAAAVRLQTEVKSVQCVTYGTLNIFDQQGAESYKALIGQNNYLGFITEEDLSRPYLPSPNYLPVESNILFSATKSPSYSDRVKQGVYSYLQPFAALGLRVMGIGVDQWEAHMPQTYLDAIPLFYKARQTPITS
jgi:hypothetical protein